MLYFDILAHELNRQIGEFLDYNSRIEFSRVLTNHEDKFVRKLKSNEHNFYVAKERIDNYMKLMRRVRNTPKKRLYIYQLFRYLLNDRDTILLDVKDQYEVFYFIHFRNRITGSAKEFMDLNSGNYGGFMSRKQQKELFDVSSKLFEKYTNYVPKKILDIEAKKIKIK